MKRLDLAEDEALCLLRHIRAAVASCKDRATQMEASGPPRDETERTHRATHAADCMLLEQVQRRLWMTIAGGGGVS